MSIRVGAGFYVIRIGEIYASFLTALAVKLAPETGAIKRAFSS